MIGLGTIVNASAIILGGVIGLIFGRFIKERVRETVVKAIGFATMIMALGGVMSEMLRVGTEGTGTLESQGTLMMIVSLAVGALLGELADIDRRFEQLGIWLRDKSGNSSDSTFVDAFVTASLTVCIGAMAIIGSIQDGISADHATLYAKSMLDLIIIVIMTASMGRGCVFSALPVLVFQGIITALAHFLAPIMTEGAIGNISLVGNVMIFCVGVNLVWPKTIRVANLLPGLVVAVIFALFA